MSMQTAQSQGYRRPGTGLGLLALLLALLPLPASTQQAWQEAQAQMLADIRAHARSAAWETGTAQLDPAVLQAMARVPRHRFVPDSRIDEAYEDRPLPIGHGQTISQPYIVALMTHLLRPRPEHRVLEIGSGSGYQAAVLAQLVREVCTIEIVAPLAQQASARLQAQGYRNVVVREADGYYGWPERAPFDGIIVTAAAGSVPPPLIAQLKPGGRMVIPVGGSFAVQMLLLIEKQADGRLRTEQILPVRFVPLTGSH